jgi:hypothetical protein
MVLPLKMASCEPGAVKYDELNKTLACNVMVRA